MGHREGRRRWDEAPKTHKVGVEGVSSAAGAGRIHEALGSKWIEGIVAVEKTHLARIAARRGIWVGKLRKACTSPLSLDKTPTLL